MGTRHELGQKPTCRQKAPYVKFGNLKKEKAVGLQSCTNLTPALSRSRQRDCSEFEFSLVYRASSSISRAVTQRNIDG